jgi:NDP-sugar pyrophosphorylase family protein
MNANEDGRALDARRAATLFADAAMTGKTAEKVTEKITEKILGLAPTIDPTAKLSETEIGAYCEVGARTMLLDVTMGDYSYVVNDSQITYTTIGKFCSIAAMTRINPGNHPMHRASQAHFTYRASAYFPGEKDEAAFFEWRRGHRVHIGHDVWIGPRHRHRRGGRRGGGRDQGRSGLHHRGGKSGAGHPAAVFRRHHQPAG